MADPNWSNTVRDDLHGDLGYPLGLGGVIYAMEQLLHPQATQCLVEILDEEARSVISNWRITTCEPGTDTDSEGLLYCRIEDEDPGAGQATIYFYRGPNRDDSSDDELVATAAGANGAALTITPETGYTLAGTVTIGTIGAGNDAHDFCIHVIVPPAQRVQQLFDGSQVDDGQIRDELLRRLSAMRASLAGARAQAEAAAAFVVNTKFRRNLVGPGLPLLTTTRRVVSGVVEETYSGILDDIYDGQADNTGGAGAIKAAAATLSGSPSFPGWQGTATGPTYGQRGHAGDWVFRTIKNLTNTAPQLQGTFTPADTRRRPGEGTQSIEIVGRPLTIGAEWSCKEFGIEALTVDYKASVSSVTSGLLSTTAGDWSVSGLTSSNSTGGVVYARYDGSTIKFYKTSAGRTAQDADDVVASVTATTGQTATTKQATGASGLTINFQTGAGSGAVLVSGSTGDIDFQAPTVTGSSLFRLTVSETTEGGEWQKRMRDGGVGGINYRVNTGTSPNLTDAQIRAGLPLINVGVSGAKY
jgi:hypothetical protein